MSEIHQQIPQEAFTGAELPLAPLVPERTLGRRRFVTLLGGTALTLIPGMACGDGANESTLTPVQPTVGKVELSPTAVPGGIAGELARLKSEGVVESQQEKQLWTGGKFIPDGISTQEQADTIMLAKVGKLVSTMKSSQNPYFSDAAKQIELLSNSQKLAFEFSLAKNVGPVMQSGVRINTSGAEYSISVSLEGTSKQASEEMAAVFLVHEMSHIKDFMNFIDPRLARGDSPQSFSNAHIAETQKPENCARDEAKAYGLDALAYIRQRALNRSFVDGDGENRANAFISYGKNASDPGWVKQAGSVSGCYK